MGFTCHSEYLPLNSVFIRTAGSAFRDEETLTSQWKKLNYLSRPDLDTALGEYRDFKALLSSKIPEILEIPGNPDLSPDAVYCRDASIATDKGMILCRMGKEARMGEPADHKAYYQAMGIPILGSIEAPGTLEGGDVAWLDTKTLAVGHSYRSNPGGIEQLKGLLKPLGVAVIVVDLPHYKGPADVFHMMSILSPVDRDLAVVYSPLMPISFRRELLDRGFTLVEVPEEEFDTMGSNVLATGPRQCILVGGNPKTHSALRQEGCEVLTYAGNEISLKGGGGPTCLTRPYHRRL